jgi:hypothetical protein
MPNINIFEAKSFIQSGGMNQIKAPQSSKLAVPSIFSEIMQGVKISTHHFAVLLNDRRFAHPVHIVLDWFSWEPTNHLCEGLALVFIEY